MRSIDSLSACMNMCNTHADCKAFEWNPGENECEKWTNMPNGNSHNITSSSTSDGYCFVKDSVPSQLKSTNSQLTVRGRGFDSSVPTKKIR